MRQEEMNSGRSSSPSPTPVPVSILFTLRRRLQLCAMILPLEAFISFEEIFLIFVLRRLSVPTSLISLSAVLSAVNGVWSLPLLGWASDRLQRCPCGWGRKRPYAMLSLAGMATGLSLLVAVQVTTLYDDSFYRVNTSDVTTTETDVTTTIAADVRSVDGSQGHGSGGGGGGGASSGITVVGWLAISCFALSDYSYSSCMATFKAYMMAVTPASQHDAMMVLATLMGAVGGCVTSLMGFVDLASIFLASDTHVDKNVFQCLVQAAIILVLVVVLGPVSLLTGSESADRVTSAQEVIDSVTSAQKPADRVTLASSSVPETVACEDLLADRRNKQQGNSNVIAPTVTRPTSLIPLSSYKTRIRKLVLIWTLFFLGLCTNYAYFLYISNYVRKVIYKGDPFGDARSDAYANYMHGVRMTSLGMAVFYCLLVVFNLLHGKVLEKVDMKAEFVISSVVCVVLMGTLVLTANVVVFFATQVAMVAYRSAVYTVPYILTNKYVQQDLTTGDQGPGSASPGSGFTMALVTSALPAAWLFVGVCMGPLLALTGYPGAPLVVALGSGGLGALTTVFVQFD